MNFSGSLCQIVAPLGAHMGMGLFLSSAKRRVNQNAVRGAGAKRYSPLGGLVEQTKAENQAKTKKKISHSGDRC